MTSEQGQAWADKHGMLFMECSAKSGENIEGLFVGLADAITGRIQKGEIDPKNESIGVKLGTLEVQKGKEESKKKECC